MADSNMTISAKTGATINGRRTKLNKVTFTQTAAGAAGNATTSFAITGTLLRVDITGGDAAWNVVLNDSLVNVFVSPSMDNSGHTFPLGLEWDGSAPDADTDCPMWGIPLVDQTLLCTISNGGTLAGVITVIWEDSDTNL
jgi:hypothetical protein